MPLPLYPIPIPIPMQAARDAHGPWDSRHTLAHLQLVRPSDLPRFVQLDVVANFTPGWLCMTKEVRGTPSH